MIYSTLQGVASGMNYGILHGVASGMNYGIPNN